MKYMFKEGGSQDDVYVWVMYGEKYERWQRQMNTLYDELPESEKASDRELADELLKLLGMRL